ncbi:MAG: HAD family hydrolase [Hyphomicrobiales bacterium]|nr:HAD family hydrolase [Hyphomicrobiales bacterium]
MKQSSVLFDLDGTLTDSAPGIFRSTRYALERLNAADGVERPVPHESELRWIVGPPLLNSFAKLVGADKAATMLAIYRERYAEVGMFENTVYPGIVGVLEALKASGYRLFVATSKLETSARPILEHFGLARYFEAIYGSQVDGSRAVKGDLIAYLIESERLAIADGAVMIGDRKHDALGARAVGIGSIGVLWGYGDAAELTAAGADPLIETPAQIPAAVATVLARAR